MLMMTASYHVNPLCDYPIRKIFLTRRLLMLMLVCNVHMRGKHQKTYI